jgi:hypothetical protein
MKLQIIKTRTVVEVCDLDLPEIPDNTDVATNAFAQDTIKKAVEELTNDDFQTNDEYHQLEIFVNETGSELTGFIQPHTPNLC